MDMILHVDGGSRGNPGPSAAAAVALQNGVAVRHLARHLGVTTNNVAEYEGLLLAFRLARAMKLQEVEVRSDSELLVKQFAGEYRMKAAHLKPLLAKARAEALRFRRVRVSHVPRERNEEADRLVNETLDRGGNAAEGEEER